MMQALLLALSVTSTGPCLSVDPAPEPDPQGAEAYRAVGDAERAAGSPSTAAIAYRRALALDPTDEVARAALRALCAESNAPRDAFAEGLRHMKAGDLGAAAEAFGEARRDGGDASAALLEGVCRYELGQDARAEPLLREAEAFPEHREAARLYLGLLALRRGAPGEAASLLDSAGGSPALGPLASDLARIARQDRPLVLTLTADSGWDSNVTLAPTGAHGEGPPGDATYRLAATGLYRPRGAVGPYLRASAAVHEQLRLDAYDYTALDGAAGWQLGGARRYLLAEYDFSYRRLGGAPLLWAHRLLASGWVTAGRFALSATALARLESYPSSEWRPLSGNLLRAEAKATWVAGPATRLGLAYGAGRDRTGERALSWTEHGPRADLRLALGGRSRLWVETGLAWRAYGAPDAATGVTRRDVAIEGAAVLELDLGPRWTARASLEVRRTLSSGEDFGYGKLFPSVGLSYLWGL